MLPYAYITSVNHPNWWLYRKITTYINKSSVHSQGQGGLAQLETALNVGRKKNTVIQKSAHTSDFHFGTITVWFKCCADWGLDIYSSMCYSFGRTDCVSFSEYNSKRKQTKSTHSAHIKKSPRSSLKKSFFLVDISIVADDDIFVHFCLPATNGITALHKTYSRCTLGSLRDTMSESGSSKAREFCVLSHIIIGIYRASLFWLQAVQRHRQFFHNGSAK